MASRYMGDEARTFVKKTIEACKRERASIVGYELDQQKNL